MNKDKFDKIISGQEELVREAMIVLEKINYLEPIDGIEYLSVQSIGCYIDFHGFMYYDGDELCEYSFSFPTELIYDKKKLKEYLDKIIERQKNLIKFSDENIAINQRHKDEKDYNKYLILKDKFKEKEQNLTLKDKLSDVRKLARLKK